MKKIQILIEGWFDIYHSYSLVCFNECKALALLNHSIYICNLPYYNPEWKKNPVISKELKKLKELKNFKEWNGEYVDIVYRIAYPYNITPRMNVPLVVFYTGEFGVFPDNSIIYNNKIINHLDLNTLSAPGLYFKTPSSWSFKAFPFDRNNRVISHGIDSSIFYPQSGNKENFGIPQTHKVILCVGAMTMNKGVDMIMEAIVGMNCDNITLVLKGIGSLYNSKGFTLAALQKTGLNISKILYIDEDLNMNEMRELYSIADVYVSPYRAEGFNLPVLEALACGCRVLVSARGGTSDFIDDLTCSMKSSAIWKIATRDVAGFNGNGIMNDIDIKHIQENLTEILSLPELTLEEKIVNGKIVSDRYDWKIIGVKIQDYFQYILNF